MINRGRFVNRRRILEATLTVLAAILLLVAAEGRHPYGFYMVLRTAVAVDAVYWAVRVYDAGPRGWLWAFVATAILLNPIFPLRMHRTDWQPIDLWLGIMLLCWAAYWAFRKQQRQ